MKLYLCDSKTKALIMPMKTRLGTQDDAVRYIEKYSKFRFLREVPTEYGKYLVFTSDGCKWGQYHYYKCIREMNTHGHGARM